MPHLDVEPTPNPNSLKITAPGHTFISNGMASFSSASEAAGHPLGSQLFQIEGVVNVFILPQFLTVTKRPDVDWDDLFPAVEHAVEQHLAQRE